MFKKGDYIVTLKVAYQHYNCARDNYCFKIRETLNSIYPEVDMMGSKSNGHTILTFDKKRSLIDWRYATQQEIEEYDKLGKPYDVTTLSKTLKPEDLVKGEWYKGKDKNNIWFFKFNQICGDKLHTDLCCTDKRNYYNGLDTTWGNITDLTITKATKEEVEKYYPDEFKSQIPEYVECIKVGIGYTKVGEIYECKLDGNEFTWKYNEKPHKDYQGLFWDKISSRGFDYYREYFKPSTKEAFEDQNKPKEEVLVFGKFKIGSIVVSLNRADSHRIEGTLVKILDKSKKTLLWYTGLDGKDVNSSTIDWRQASEEECKAFEQGITNIKDIKPVEENLVGRYLKVLPNAKKPEKYLLITNQHPEHGENYFTKEYPNQWMDIKWRINKQHFELMPVGFTPESEVKEDYSFYVKYTIDFTEDIFDKLVSWCNSKKHKDSRWYSCFSNKYQDFKVQKHFWVNFKMNCKHGSFCGVNNNPQGYKRLSLSELCDLIGYKQQVKEESINTYGLKIGDKLPEKVINAWAKTVGSCHNNTESKFYIKDTPFIGDRTISSFKIIDNNTGILVSGTEQVYLKAEGFKEFMENFDKPKVNLIKDKWYSAISNYGGKKWQLYFKFNSFTTHSDGEHVKFVYDSNGYNAINHNGEYGQASSILREYLSDIKEINTSEIQQWLPDNHSDKFKSNNMEELPKEWCIKNTNDNNSFIIQFLKQKSGYDRDNGYFAGTSKNSYYGIKNNKVDHYVRPFGKELTLGEFKRLVLKESIMVYRDDQGRELKTYLSGEWYYNPEYEKSNTINNRNNRLNKGAKYTRVKTATRINTGNGYYYTQFEFDAAITPEGELLEDLSFTQANTDFEYKMVKVEFSDIYKKSNSLDEDLLAEAKKRFPIGTKFYPAHLSQRKEYCIITNTDFKVNGTEILALTDDGRTWTSSSSTKYGNTDYNRCVYDNGKWATIVPNTTTEEFKVGDWVTVIKNTTSSGNNIGATRQITKIHSIKYCDVGPPDSGFLTDCADIRHATAEEIAKAQGNTTYGMVEPKLEKSSYFSEEKLQQPPVGSSMETILAYCKQKYPVGTKYNSLIVDNIEREVLEGLRIDGNNIMTGGNYVYENGKYAEIVSTPEKSFEPYDDKVMALYLSTGMMGIDPAIGYNKPKKEPFKVQEEVVMVATPKINKKSKFNLIIN